ncbi:MAG: hypothetical protein M3N08_03635 [Pseudomonadota bacterium]|nr:hypothetical protein [Pseudomonadota bacterium]
MDTPDDNMQSAANNASNAAERMFKTIKDTADHLKDDLRDGASKVESAACKTGKEASELACSVGKRACDASDTVMAEIRRKPVQSVFIALAIGFFGALLCPRSA